MLLLTFSPGFICFLTFALVYLPQISQAKDDLIPFSSSPGEASPRHEAEQETTVQQQPQTVRWTKKKQNDSLVSKLIKMKE